MKARIYLVTVMIVCITLAYFCRLHAIFITPEKQPRYVVMVYHDNGMGEFKISTYHDQIKYENGQWWVYVSDRIKYRMVQK